MNMTFERLRLQMHMRQLYEGLGAMDAELLILNAFEREHTRHESMTAAQRATHTKLLSD